MKDTVIELDNKFIKSLNDLNQELKNVFDKYIIYENKVYALDKDMVSNKGRHFGFLNMNKNHHIKVLRDHDDNYPMMFSAQHIYDAISKHKKELKNIVIKNNKILLDDYCIGQYVKASSVIDAMDKQYYTLTKLFESISETNISIPNSVILKLMANEYINIFDKEYTMRITRELIPGLKKKYESLDCRYASKDSNTYLTYITTNRLDLVKTIHVYTCIKNLIF